MSGYSTKREMDTVQLVLALKGEHSFKAQILQVPSRSSEAKLSVPAPGEIHLPAARYCEMLSTWALGHGSTTAAASLRKRTCRPQRRNCGYSVPSLETPPIVRGSFR
jgi:hypothetical protein